MNSQQKPASQTRFPCFELARVSNLPTCVSNVLVGSAAVSPEGLLSPWRVLAATAATVLLYTAGMAMNDAVDADTDRRDCPDRPIPSGRVTPAQAWGLAVVAAATGLGVLGAVDLVAFGLGVALVAAVIAYNVTHKKTPFAAAVMGVCRGLVYLVAAAVVAPQAWWSSTPVLLPLAATLAVYIAAITAVARTEHQSTPAAQSRLLAALPFVVVAAGLWTKPDRLLWSAAAAAGMVVWFYRGLFIAAGGSDQVKKAVVVWISGICLVDAYLLSLLNRPFMVLIAVVCFVLTASAHRRIPGS